MSLGNLDDLRMFVQILDSGSLSAAARAMGVHKNRVSRRLRDLEDALGVVLVHRTTRSMTPTAEGRILYDGAVDLLGRRSRLEARLSGTTLEPRGELRVLVPTITLQLGLVGQINETLSNRAGLSFHIDVSDQPLDPARAGYDVVVHIGAPPDSNYVAHRLAMLVPSLAAATDYVARHGRPEAPPDLRDHPCLLFARGQSEARWRLVSRQGELTTVTVQGRLTSRDSRLLQDALYAGMGIGVRPTYEIAAAAGRGALVPILPDYSFEPFDVWALVPRSIHRTPRITALLAVLGKIFRGPL